MSTDSLYQRNLLAIIKPAINIMKFGAYESSTVLAPTSTMSSQFQLEPSSVIKTAPPGSRHLDLMSGKGDGFELTQLSNQNLSDLSKMQPIEHYYQMPNYSRVYTDYAIAGLATGQQQNTVLQGTNPNQGHNTIYYPAAVFPSNAAAVVSGGLGGGGQQDWQRVTGPTMVDQYTTNVVYPRTSTIQYHHQTQDLNQQDRIFKQELPSPVDSGIGTDLSLLCPKDDFYITSQPQLQHVIQQTNVQTSDCHQQNGVDRTSDRLMSHRESPVNIPKLHNTLGFQYVLEAPISTSIRKEDDRMTYVNKGQFYTISLDYLHDPSKPLKSSTVKSILMVVFREDKTYEEEIKTWQFWHGRQHSSKQRIMEVDSKNSSGIIGQIEEVAHNAVQFYWNPSETSVKISIAVQCLSTDFSNQKGVKGLPLHIQIDTYDEGDDGKIPFHRGFCQIKVFCDKGAERKLRDEDKRAQKRKITGRKKSDGEYHEPCDRSEFYHMSDLEKPAALFVASDDFDTSYLDTSSLNYDGLSDMEPMAKRPRTAERVMIYVRKRDEAIYTPLHIVPPSLVGLVRAIGEKFGVDGDKVTALYKQCLKGVTVKMDDDMLKHYCNEDTFVIDIENTQEDHNYYAVTLTEVQTNNQFVNQS